MCDITNADINNVVEETGNFPEPEIVFMYVEAGLEDAGLKRAFNLDSIDSDLIYSVDQVLISDPEWSPTPTPVQQVTLNMKKVSLLLKLHKAARQEQRIVVE